MSAYFQPRQVKRARSRVLIHLHASQQRTNKAVEHSHTCVGRRCLLLALIESTLAVVDINWRTKHGTRKTMTTNIYNVCDGCIIVDAGWCNTGIISLDIRHTIIVEAPIMLFTLTVNISRTGDLKRWRRHGRSSLLGGRTRRGRKR